jgi:hypothetical protein
MPATPRSSARSVDERQQPPQMAAGGAPHAARGAEPARAQRNVPDGRSSAASRAGAPEHGAAVEGAGLAESLDGPLGVAPAAFA